MNWREIQKEWEAGNHEIAIRLLYSMIYGLRFKQKRLFDFAYRANAFRTEKEGFL